MKWGGVAREWEVVDGGVEGLELWGGYSGEGKGVGWMLWSWTWVLVGGWRGDG